MYVLRATSKWVWVNKNTGAEMIYKQGIMVKLATVALGLILGLGTATASETTATAEAVEGSSKAAKLEACVAPTPFMRRNHFELIKHQRDITVHEGVRKTDDSLSGCVDCHANKDAHGEHIPVDGEKQFCASCHTYTAVTFDCFTCHATTPTPGK